MVGGQTMTSFTCARCKRIALLPGTPSAPKNWLSVVARYDKDEMSMGGLCNECGGDLYDWVTGKSATSVDKELWRLRIEVGIYRRQSRLR